MSEKVYRHEPPPRRMRHLPVDARGYVVPWFVAFVDGVPHFEMIGEGKITAAIKETRCWLCGQETGRYISFVIGPMCAVNRTTAEPPCHLECAQFAARVCPFLSNPQMGRIPEHKLGEHMAPAGVGLKRNPGVALVWTTTSYQVYRVKPQAEAQGGILFQIGEPTSLEWYAHGRTATRAEILRSIETGAPLLMELAEKQEREEPQSGALAAFDDAMARAMALVPAA